MKKRYYLLGIIFYILFYSHVFSQIPDNDDSNWNIKDTAKSDEFNKSYLAAKWRNNIGGCITHGSEELQYYDPSNISFDGQHLKLHAHRIRPTYINYDPCGKGGGRNYSYTSGAITSMPATTSYGYGYYEMSAKIPKLKGCWPAFWLNRFCSGYPGQEIDIVEPNGYDSQTCTQYNANVWYDNDGNDTVESYSPKFEGDGSLLQGFTDLSTSYHKYAVEWSPGYVYFYLDDNLVKVTRPPTINSNWVPNHAMDLFFNLAVDYCHNNRPDSTVGFDAYLDIDYFHYYTLNMTGCTVDYNQSNVNFDNYSYTMKKSITISNTNVPTGKNITIRASDYIILNSFQVACGTEFNAVTTPCYEGFTDTCPD
jgi:beta-glucanase (GH16 family)